MIVIGQNARINALEKWQRDTRQLLADLRPFIADQFLRRIAESFAQTPIEEPPP